MFVTQPTEAHEWCLPSTYVGAHKSARAGLAAYLRHLLSIPVPIGPLVAIRRTSQNKHSALTLIYAVADRRPGASLNARHWNSYLDGLDDARFVSSACLPYQLPASDDDLLWLDDTQI